MTHDTTTASLEGIAGEEAILSAAESIKRGLIVRSGEYIEHSAGYGLGDVHASPAGIGSGNTSLYFFDDEIVSFIYKIDLASMVLNFMTNFISFYSSWKYRL